MNKAELLLLVLLPTALLATSQNANAQAANAANTLATAPATQAQVITLGNSAVALNGPWKFQPGDSPWVDGAPLWAQPGFDDSHWAAMDLTSKAGAMDLMNGTTGFVPGWTQKGYPELSGYAWYRLRLRVENADQPLWLKMPNDFDDAYQVYANGHYVGQYGGFSGKNVTEYYSEPESFALPAPGSDGEIDVAVRFYMNAATFFNGPDVGGMHGAPALGLASTVQLLQTADYDAILHNYFGGLLQTFLFILAAPMALWAWLYSRREHMWMWLFLALAWSIFNIVLSVLAGLTTVLTIAESTWVGIIFLPFWSMFWWNWFGLQEKKWIPRLAWLLAAVFALIGFCVQSPNLGLNFLSPAALHWFNTAGIWVSIPYQLMVIVVLVLGFRRDRLEALMAAVPILLGMYSAYGGYLLNTFHIRNTFYPFGLGIGVGNVVAMLQIVVVGALALRRFMRTQVRESLTRQAVKKDMEQAQQLQQRVLIPEAIDSRVFSVESEYRPAQTVGGDFFQTLTKTGRQPAGGDWRRVGQGSQRGDAGGGAGGRDSQPGRAQLRSGIDAGDIESPDDRALGRKFCNLPGRRIEPRGTDADRECRTYAAIPERQGAESGRLAATGNQGGSRIQNADRYSATARQADVYDRWRGGGNESSEGVVWVRAHAGHQQPTRGVNCEAGANIRAGG
jgi:hypothetical protein